MKLFAFALLVLCATALVDGSPANRKKQPKCDLSCSSDYSPVCGALPSDKSVKPKLFGNQCVLETYNCENKSNLVKVNIDECKNSGGVRLS